MLHNLLMFKLLLIFFLTGSPVLPNDSNDPNAICGKWISAHKDYLVQVYRDGNSFKGRTLWFKNKDTSKAMDEWTDKHNPNPTLRGRKLIGINILTDLTYNRKSNSWENGRIYDATKGSFWDASVTMTKEGSLKVTGYWHFKFIGKSVTFVRYNNEILVN